MKFYFIKMPKLKIKERVWAGNKTSHENIRKMARSQLDTYIGWRINGYNSLLFPCRFVEWLAKVRGMDILQN